MLILELILLLIASLIFAAVARALSLIGMIFFAIVTAFAVPIILLLMVVGAFIGVIFAIFHFLF